MSWTGSTLDDLIHGCVGGSIDLTSTALWPPDVFAIAGAFLECTGAYRWIVDAGPAWPPTSNWHEQVETEGAHWAELVGDWRDNNFGRDPYQASSLPDDLPNPLRFMDSRRTDLLKDLAGDRSFVSETVRALASAATL